MTQLQNERVKIVEDIQRAAADGDVRENAPLEAAREKQGLIESQIKTIEINVNDAYDFGTLKIEIYACYKRPPEEIPEDFVLISVLDEIKDNEFEQVFKGWMISSSPSVTPFEHPIYDLWLKDCKIETDS